MFFVYALYSSEYDKIYVGFTADVERRLAAHNHPENKNWTGKFQPWKVIYTESFQTKGEAMKREKELKSFRGREFIRSLIKS
jgi:putative endonuclease